MKALGNKHAVLIQFSDFGLGRGLFLAETLASLGIFVTVFTNKPIYTNSMRPSDVQMKIVELPIHLAKTLYRTVFGRLIVYAAITAFSFLRFFKENPRPDILYSRGPQPFTEVPCIVYKRFFGKNVKVISDTTDLWPDALKYVQMNAVFRNLLLSIGHAINKLIYSRIDVIVTHNEELKAVLQNRFDLPTHVIYGVINLEKFRPLNRADVTRSMPSNLRRRIADRFVVLYAGLLGPFQNPLVIPELAKLSKDLGVLFLVLGEGSLRGRIIQEIERNNLENLLMFETQPFEKMPLVYGIADVFLLTYPSIEFLKTGLPKKFIEYSACGKPIVCISPSCVASRLCLKWKAGYRVDPDDLREARSIIRLLMEDETAKKELGQNSRKLAESLFSINRASEILSGIIQE